MTARPVPWSRARNLVVTAEILSPVVLPTQFPAPLDGILAATQRGRPNPVNTPPRDRLEADPHGRRDDWVAAYRAMFRTVPLPLAKLTRRDHNAPGNNPIWVASQAHPHRDCAQQVTHIHNRFDQAAAELLGVELPANPQVGATKAWRIPLVETVTPTLQWRAVGDPDGVADLCERVLSAGKRKAAGFGAIRSIVVEDAGASDPCDMWALIRDGHPDRPLPVRCADRLGFGATPETTLGQFRPPYWRAPLHDGTRQPAALIHPTAESRR